MIKAKVVSVTYSESVGGIPKLDLETHLEDPVVPELFCGADFWDGLDVVVITKEEYEAMDSSSNVLRQSLLEEREKTKQLKERIKELQEENTSIKDEIKNLKEKMDQTTYEVDIHPDGTMVFKNKRVSELIKEVENLKERVGIYENCLC